MRYIRIHIIIKIITVIDMVIYKVCIFLLLYVYLFAALFSVQTILHAKAVRGQNVTLLCSVNEIGSSDNRDFNFKWSLGNDSLSDACAANGEASKAGKYAFDRGNSSCNLTILGFELSDEGRYRCDVNDSFYMQSNHVYSKVLGEYIQFYYNNCR